MKKTLYTLNIENYAPEMMQLTMPLMKRYAKKIGADFHVIQDRKFPDFPIPYEKFQIYELSKKHENDWNVFYDADALIHPDMWDPTEVIDKSTTISHGTDFTPMRFKPDEYFKRDGRFIGKGNWCAYFSDWCRDYYHPLEDMTAKEAANRITPIVSELGTVIDPIHLVDDYTVSRNISRYGLKHIILPDISERVKVRQGMFLHHYTMPVDQKTFNFKKQLLLWAVEGLVDDERQQEIINMIMQLAWIKDKELDWNDFVSVLPNSKRIVNIIKSWDIDIEYKKFDKVNTKLKKNMLMTPLQNVQDCKEKQEAQTAIETMQENISVSDLLGSLKLGLFIADFLKLKLDIDIKVTPVEIVEGAK